MQIEEFGWEYNVGKHFPNAQVIRRSGYEYLYSAEQSGQFCLIEDRSLTADYICPLQPGIEETSWVKVLIFESEDARQSYLEAHWPTNRLNLNVSV